jgi:hypothetical protein
MFGTLWESRGRSAEVPGRPESVASAEVRLMFDFACALVDLIAMFRWLFNGSWSIHG